MHTNLIKKINYQLTEKSVKLKFFRNHMKNKVDLQSTPRFIKVKK